VKVLLYGCDRNDSGVSVNTGDLSLGAQEYNITQHKLAEVRRQINGLNAP
jgi:hypothetical protein